MGSIDNRLQDARLAFQQDRNIHRLSATLKDTIAAGCKPPMSVVHSAFQDVLHAGADRVRHELMPIVEELVPAIAVVGGQEVVIELARAIDDVGRWWS
jgi:hypothetical protein